MPSHQIDGLIDVSKSLRHFDKLLEHKLLFYISPVTLTYSVCLWYKYFIEKIEFLCTTLTIWLLMWNRS